jgi:hypothetical protein
MLLVIGDGQAAGFPQTACSPEMYERADAALAKAAGDWRSLLVHQKTFASCDDGGLAEGYSDAVVNLLARHWDHLDVFVNLAEQNPSFRRWAIRHIDASASTDDLGVIVRYADRCGRSMKRRNVCIAIRRAAIRALGD